MKELELKDLIELNDEVVGDGLILTENGHDKYIVLRADSSANMDVFNPKAHDISNVKIVTNGDMKISAEEFEEIKRQLIEALEDSIKPIDPENMN